MRNLFFRIVLFFLIAGIGCSNYSQEPEWKRITSPVNATLTNMSFVNRSTGWISGEQGTIIKTTDGGRNWQIQNSTVTSFITSICFVDENYGWAVTVKENFPFNTLILKTTNGGEEWIAENFQDSSALMRTIFFFDSLHGFIGGSYIAETNNGGNTWIKATVDSGYLSAYPVYKFKFYNEQFGYACGGAIDIAGVIWRTTDYGANWTATGVSADQVFDLFMFDSLNAITLSGDPEGFFGIAKIKTIDGGLNWGHEELPIFGLSFAIDFRNSNEGWSASGFKLLSSYDGGETWNEKDLPDSVTVYSIQFVDSLTGFAAGANGLILKYIPSPVSVKSEGNSFYKFKLNQNYPNPFNSSTQIKFTLPQVKEGETSEVSLKIFDVLGNEVAKLVNDEKPAGTYTATFNATDLPSGVYFYRLQAGVLSQVKKMIYIK
jgi:photosystem II stability/assembly factor-like uncharacterized protein